MTDHDVERQKHTSVVHTVTVCDETADACEWFLRQNGMYYGHRHKRTSQRFSSREELQAAMRNDELEWSEWK